MPTTFTTFGLSRSSAPPDLGRERADVDRRIGERLDRGGDVGGRKRRQVALDIDDDVGAAVRVGRLQRLEDAVGARGMIGARHHGAPAGLFHAGRDRLRIGRNHDRTDVRRPAPAA